MSELRVFMKVSFKGKKPVVVSRDYPRELAPVMQKHDARYVLRGLAKHPDVKVVIETSNGDVKKVAKLVWEEYVGTLMVREAAYLASLARSYGEKLEKLRERVEKGEASIDEMLALGDSMKRALALTIKLGLAKRAMDPEDLARLDNIMDTHKRIRMDLRGGCRENIRSRILHMAIWGALEPLYREAAGIFAKYSGIFRQEEERLRGLLEKIWGNTTIKGGSQHA